SDAREYRLRHRRRGQGPGVLRHAVRVLRGADRVADDPALLPGRRAMSIWIILALAACNQVLGLERTYTAEQDVDGDHVPNGVENCPDVPNPDQADRDHDGVGDACDGCPDVAGGDNHDEDGDRRADRCDLCPAVPDFQLDADGDGIGDACDANAGKSSRLAFDGFAMLAQDWVDSGAHWELVGDAVAPHDALVATDVGLQRMGMNMESGIWSVRAEFL